MVFNAFFSSNNTTTKLFLKIYILIIIRNIAYGNDELRICKINCIYKRDIKDIATTFCSQVIFQRNECPSTREKGCMSFYFKSQVIDRERISFHYSGCYDDEFISLAKNMNFSDFPPNTYIDSTIMLNGYNFYVFGSRNTLIKP
uniref:Uncharacterized protein n=1 Tax=Strongyloides papillosus TaxID=174720 RepID=A0A0N5BN70_STREA